MNSKNTEIFINKNHIHRRLFYYYFINVINISCLYIHTYRIEIVIDDKV